MKTISKIFLSIFPLLLTPLWIYLISQSYLNFGAGDKDIVIITPYLAWSVLYLLIFIVCWIKDMKLKQILIFSFTGATVILIAMLIVLYIYVWTRTGILK